MNIEHIFDQRSEDQAISIAGTLEHVSRRQILYRKGLDLPSIFTDTRNIAQKCWLLEMGQQSLISELEWMGEQELAQIAVELGSKMDV